MNYPLDNFSQSIFFLLLLSFIWNLPYFISVMSFVFFSSRQVFGRPDCPWIDYPPVSASRMLRLQLGTTMPSKYLLMNDSPFLWGSDTGPILLPRILWLNWEDEYLSKGDWLDWLTWCGWSVNALYTLQTLRIWQLLSPRGRVLLKAWRMPFTSVSEWVQQQQQPRSSSSGGTRELGQWGQEQEDNRVDANKMTGRACCPPGRQLGKKHCFLPGTSFL